MKWKQYIYLSGCKVTWNYISTSVGGCDLFYVHQTILSDVKLVLIIKY